MPNCSDATSPGRSEPWDVAIVLGAAIDRDGRPSQALLRRTTHAASLFLSGRAKALLMSGGGLCPPPTEASLMREVAMASGVPEGAIYVEDESRTTFENAALCRPIVDRMGWRTIVIVTDGYHMRRSLYTFRRFGMPAEGSAAPRGGGMVTIMLATIREAVGLLVYRRRIARHFAGKDRSG